MTENARGIQSLPGGIVIDKRAFSVIEQDPAQFDRAPLRPYNVAPDAMLFNFKAIEFKLIPADGAVAIAPHPNPSGLVVTNHLRLTNEACGDWKTKARAEFSTEATSARATFPAHFPRSAASGNGL
jgi:serine-type D-Ala-D-Ala carboxypeptidase/endopeptidase (penicillin-binding protein 4)